MNPVFITGGTGYLGVPLISALLQRGFDVRALVRPGSEMRLPPGAVPIAGDALDASTFASAVPSGSTFVQLVGTPHPNPSKAAEFRRVDLGSVRASVSAAQRSGVRHFVHVSVAHPAPIMQAYIASRVEAEAIVIASGIPATILRPWYVLGPGHRWPYLLVPFYAVLRWLPPTRESAERLGLVTRAAMVAALLRAIEAGPKASAEILGVPEIRRAAA